jgi:hypothetical protein
MTVRVTLIAYRRIKSPVKFTMYPSLLSGAEPIKRANPVSAVTTATRKMTIPTNVCQGRSVALAVFFALGKKYVKKPNTH